MNEDKFGRIEDNFIFKLNLFYDKCQLVDLLLDVYLKSAPVMLTSQAQTYFYTNCKSIVSFNDFQQKTQLLFEGL